jgi:hypothetical protein
MPSPNFELERIKSMTQLTLIDEGVHKPIAEAKQMLEHRTTEEYDQWRNSLHEAIKQTH